MEKLINRLVSEYLRERGFNIGSGLPDEIWTRKKVDIRAMIVGTDIALCKSIPPSRKIAIDLYQPNSLQEIAAILYICHGVWGDCTRCAIPTMKKQNLAELNKLIEELK